MALMRACYLLLSVGFLFLGTASFAATTQKKCDLEFRKLHYCGTIHWVKAPHAVEMITPQDAAEMKIEFKKLGGAKSPLTNDVEMSVKPTMPSMGGHGTEPTRVSRNEGSEPASYEVKEIFLSMPGEWKFEVKLRKKGKELDRASWVFNLK